MKRSRLVLPLFFALSFASPVRAADAMPHISNERVVFHTLAGDLVFALYPKAAPKTVEQFLKLVRLGVYDTTHFFRVEKNFVVQLGVAEDRLRPLTPEQKAAIHKLPLEASPTVKHLVWRLSMAHQDGDVNSGETSFSILLADAPHLDGKYTVFGHVERGFDVIAQMLKVSRDSSNRPLVRLNVDYAEVFPSMLSLAKVRLQPAVPIRDGSTQDVVALLGLRPVVIAALALIALISLGAFFLPLSARHLTSLHLINVLIAVFAVMTVVLGSNTGANTTPVAGALVFVALIGTFKLMNRFESY